MTDEQIYSFAFWASVIASLTVVAIWLTLAARLVRHWVRQTRPSLLLIRDVALFTVFIVLVMGNAVGREAAWIVFRSVVVLAALVLWIAVEWGAIGRQPEDRT